MLDSKGAVVLGTLALHGLALVGAIAVELRHNPNGQSWRYRTRRVRNWISLGLAYNAAYAARYAVTVANVPAVRAALGVSHATYGLVLTCGFWSYALFTLVNGYQVRDT